MGEMNSRIASTPATGDAQLADGSAVAHALWERVAELERDAGTALVESDDALGQQAFVCSIGKARRPCSISARPSQVRYSSTATLSTIRELSLGLRAICSMGPEGFRFDPGRGETRLLSPEPTEPNVWGLRSTIAGTCSAIRSTTSPSTLVG